MNEQNSETILINWKVGNSEDIRFWKDKWLSNCEPLYTYCVRNSTEVDFNLPVSHFVQTNGEWNLFLFEKSLPEHICGVISTITPIYPSRGR